MHETAVFILQAEAKTTMKNAKAKYRFLGQDLERVSWREHTRVKKIIITDSILSKLEL